MGSRQFPPRTKVQILIIKPAGGGAAPAVDDLAFDDAETHPDPDFVAFAQRPRRSI